jgi:hypothetical protein
MLNERQEGSVLKKGKAGSAESMPSSQSIPVFDGDDSADEQLIEKSLVVIDHTLSRPLSTTDDPFTVHPKGSMDSAFDSGSSEPSPRKRKRVFMDAVEVPTLREIIIREQKATPDKRSLRRSRSAATKPFGVSSVRSSLCKSLEQKSRKRFKRYSSNSLFSTSSLEDMDVAGSGWCKLIAQIEACY